MISSRPEQALGDRQRADLVVGDHAAGVADDVRVAFAQPERSVGVQPRVHARHDRDRLARRERQVALVERGDVGLVVAQQLVGDAHGAILHKPNPVYWDFPGEIRTGAAPLHARARNADASLMDGVLNIAQPAPSALDALAGVAREDAADAIERSLAAARELLGMQLAYVAEIDESDFRFAAFDGDPARFGLPPVGVALPRAATLCHQMLSGNVGHVLPDARPEEAARLAGVGAYVGVPVRLADGAVYGSLCCSRAAPHRGCASATRACSRCWRGSSATQIDRERRRRRTQRLEGEASAGQALLAALKARERYTAEHSEAVRGARARRGARAGAVRRRGRPGRAGGAAARRRQGRRARRDPAEAGQPERRRVAIVREHPAIGERDRRRDRVARPPRAGRARRARALGRRRLPRRARRRRDPAREPHLPGLRRLARDDLRPPVPRARCRPPRRAPSSSATPAASSARAPSPRCSPCSTARPAAPVARRRPEHPAGGDAPLESELRALIAVAGAVAAAHRLEDVLEVVAEETRRVVRRARRLSISRWEREHDRVRTLINVGELGPDEERFPVAETYDLADYPLRRGCCVERRVVRDLARRRTASGRTSGSCWRRSSKGSYIGVPVIFDGAHVGQARGVRERRRRPVHAPRTSRSWRRSPARSAPRSAAPSCSRASTRSPTPTR